MRILVGIVVLLTMIGTVAPAMHDCVAGAACHRRCSLETPAVRTEEANVANPNCYPRVARTVTTPLGAIT